MKRRRSVATVATAVALLVMTAVPSHGVTGWLTRANTTGKGAGAEPTMAGAIVTLPKPHAIRVGVSTPKGVSKRVDVDALVECETTSKENTKRVTTKTDGTLTWVTLFDGSVDLGRACWVLVMGSMNNTTKLRTVVQYKSR